MSEHPDPTRRRLMTGAPLLGAGVLLLTETEPASAAEQPCADDPLTSTFHETEHVRTFYRLARS